MNGFYLGKSCEFLEKVIQKSGELSLIGKGDGTEVLVQKINKGISIFIEPAEDSDCMEFFYVIEGSLSYEHPSDEFALVVGDYFYAHHLSDTVRLKALENTTLLYISTQPIFHYLSKDIKKLTEIVNQIETKDVYTHNHGKRVRDYSLMIGRELSLSSEAMENLGFSSMFHDIGKSIVPDEILNKPDRLTEEEFECIKRHPTDGSKIVSGTFLRHLAEIIIQHHERLDGSGYPNGLKENEICIEAKIIGVADTFDAMTTDRPYRKGLSFETAISELVKYSGIQYDSEVVLTFRKILDRVNAAK